MDNSQFQDEENTDMSGGAPKGHQPYNAEGEGGRPIKYDQAFIEAEAIALEEWMKRPESIYFKRFAFDRGYSQQRLSEFADVNQRFSETLARAREWQEIRLAEGGLTNEFNSNFCKFVMGNACGWSDKTESKITGDAANPLAFILKNIDGTSRGLLNDERK
jgi:hypothetical protein